MAIRGNVHHVSDIVQCVQAQVDSEPEFTTIEIRCVVLAMMEEHHANVVANACSLVNHVTLYNRHKIIDCQVSHHINGG